MKKSKNEFVDSLEVRMINGNNLEFKKQDVPWFIEFKRDYLEIVSNLQPEIIKHDDGNHEMFVERHYIPLMQIREVKTIESNFRS